MNFSNKEIPLNLLFNECKFILLSITPNFEFVNGQRTNNQIGYRYTVVEDGNYDKFSVKIASEKPLLTNDQIASAKAKIYVTFENAYAKFYLSQSKEIQISVNAISINLVK